MCRDYSQGCDEEALLQYCGEGIRQTGSREGVISAIFIEQ